MNHFFSWLKTHITQPIIVILHECFAYVIYMQLTHMVVSVDGVFSPSVSNCVEIHFLDVKCILLRAIE